MHEYVYIKLGSYFVFHCIGIDNIDSPSHPIILLMYIHIISLVIV